MSSSYWQEVLARGLPVPDDRPLADLTAELTRLLGSPDPSERGDTAYPALATWIERGVYDRLLVGLGDGMTAGLTAGLGEQDTDSVFRRSFSVRVLADCVLRDNARSLVPATRVLEWGDRVSAWYLRERDLRGYVPGKGWAHAVAHGADAIGALAQSGHLQIPELTVLLDVIADRLLLPTESVLSSGEPDRMAAATLQILRRNLVPLSVVEPWVARLAAAACDQGTVDRDPYLVSGNPESFLRALYLYLVLGPRPPENRADLILVLIDALRTTNRQAMSSG